jgi:hypothetical protein
MTSSSLSFFQRLPLALSNLFRILFDGAWAARVQALDTPSSAGPTTGPTSAPSAPVATPPAPPAPPPAPPAPSHAPTDSALQLLALLQRDARLIDFTQEDLSAYADADIGAAARVVHEGCRKVLAEHFSLQAVRSEAEGSRITLASGFDANSVRLTGNVVGSAPFSGTLSHPGWRVATINLPKLAPGFDTRILAPAEVEL